MDKNKKELLKKVLLAQAIGDAFGFFIEFKSWEDIKRLYGSEGLKYPPNVLKLIATDDTQMSLFCLEGLLKTKNNEDPTVNIFKSYLNWFDTKWNVKKSKNDFDTIENHMFDLMDCEELFFRRAPDTTCLSALGSKKMGNRQ